MLSHRDVISFLTKTLELRAVRAQIDVPTGTIGQLGKRETIAAEFGPVGETVRVHPNLPRASAAIVDTYASGAASKVRSDEVRLEFTGVTSTIGGANFVEVNGKRYVFWSTGSAPVGAGNVTVQVAPAGLATTCAGALVTTMAALGVSGVAAITLPTDPDVVKLTSATNTFTMSATLDNVSISALPKVIGGVAAFEITTPPQASVLAGDTTVVAFDNYNLPNGLATLSGPTITLEAT